MTIKKDNYEDRVKKLGEGHEQTVGVPIDGMQDPTGEYPKRDYNFGSSLNTASRGLSINELDIGGGYPGLDLGIVEQRPSEFPFNQVQETPSGHVIEMDDTPGGERILIKHRKGAGVEVRADGTVIVASKQNKIEVTGGDQNTIVEGNGNLIYKGNLNLVVTGDYNVDVGGDYNVNVAGDHKESIEDNYRRTVGKNRSSLVRGKENNKVIGERFDIYLDKHSEYVKGDKKNWIKGSNELVVDVDMFTSAKESYAVTSKTASIVGTDTISVFGNDGTIGGKKVDFTGQSYMGHLGPKPFESGATFYGSFHGQVTEAMFSRFSWFAERAKYAEMAKEANKAGVAESQEYGEALTGTQSINNTIPDGGSPETTWNQEVHGPDGPPPVPPIVAAHSTMGPFAIRDVQIDPANKLKDRLGYTDEYAELFSKIPTTAEIRSKFRIESNRDTLGAILVAEGRISSNYKKPNPPKIGRTVTNKPSPRFGFTPIGNALENRGKRFTPREKNKS